ncbi:NERD domain-containing protein [Microcoleus sp. LEGE 07076]|uniref:nuclease-related domain-containing DEAD/DEAH box helicase n=1 Tax=Microcoleus sp. LEGE 07076 TaxID=915322 RepID=UPI00187E2DC5|nr:NERD domain-containing protein [Microcoleus sp. LEGE 07076]MBE9186217.1 NERD domain-containing protein [Microcoleus sp. LEGE 07076]
MARMIPKKLSSTTRSYAEKTLFQIFENNLSNDYVVFHGAWWQDTKDTVQDREADFIVIHPDRGILIVEVKGGKISYDPVNMVWYQNEHKMKISPFKQAKDIRYKFFNFLKKYPEFNNIFFCIGQCVAFCDIDEVVNNLPSEAPQDILLLRPHLGNISGWISSVFDYYKPKGNFTKLGEQRTDLIINLISPSTKFQKYIANDISETNQEILQLTEQQFDILNNLCLHTQCIVLGCAGSGKTQLAIEKARRLCQHKVRTLVICKSNNLSLYLAASLQDEITVGYCVVYSYEEIPPQKSQLTFEFAAIIVDEGQDFEQKEINDLKQLIPDDGIFYIFQDSNQNLSKNAKKLALKVSPNVLDKNCRNTDKIFKYAEPFVSCIHPIKSSSIKGREVIHRIYEETDDIFSLVEKYITAVVNNDKVFPDQIVILTDMYPSSKSIFSQYLHIDRFHLKPYSFSNKDQNTIHWSNIGMYKGLESDVIVLVFEKEKKLIPSNWDIADRYVGATRAKSFLVIYEPPDQDIDF